MPGDAPLTYKPADARHLTFTWDGGPLIQVHTSNLGTPWAVIAVHGTGRDGSTEHNASSLKTLADEWRATH